MFYRELASNAMDEHGTIESGDFANFEPQAGGETIILVTGLDSCHRDRGETFLQTQPFAITPDLEIHRRDPANGLTNYLYYRGVRVAELLSPTQFNYNIVTQMELTEDRTLKYLWTAQARISNGIIAATELRQCRRDRKNPAGSTDLIRGPTSRLRLFAGKSGIRPDH